MVGLYDHNWEDVKSQQIRLFKALYIEEEEPYVLGYAYTLLKTQALFKEFTEEPVLAFISTEVHANLKEYLLESKAGAGNLYSTETISIDLEGFGDVTEGEGQVNIKVNKFDDLYLIPVPTDRMHTLVTFLDGHSEGQEDGGYVPATEEVGYGKIHILAFPATSCYAAIKFLVANLHYPTEEPSLIPSASELAEIKTNLTGAVEFSSITPNELASEFAMNLRTVYGGGIVPGREETVYAVTTALKA